MASMSSGPALLGDTAEAAANRCAYDALAEEYSGSDHSTIRDFQALTRRGIQIHADSLRSELRGAASEDWLVVGPGHGASLPDLFEVLDMEPNHLAMLDISPEMIRHLKSRGTRLDKAIIGPIEEFHGHDRQYSVILAFLCDPYLSPTSLDAMARALKPGGYLLATFPTSVWAETVRPPRELNVSWFQLRNGGRVWAASHCWSQAKFLSETARLHLKPIIWHDLTTADSKLESEINCAARTKFELKSDKPLPVLSFTLLKMLDDGD